MLHCIVSYESVISLECTRSLMDRTEASDAFNAGSIPVGCIYITLIIGRDERSRLRLFAIQEIFSEWR